MNIFRRIPLDEIPIDPPAPCEEMKSMARYIAMAVRNELETFHIQHVPDDLMPELNRTIRNAILTALYAAYHGESNPFALQFFRFQRKCIPVYWEPPVLLEDFSRESYRKIWEKIPE